MKKMHGLFRRLPVVAALLLPACAPVGTFQSARTLKPGYWRAQFIPVVTNALPDEDAGASFGTDVEVRVGLHKNADAGIRAGSSGVRGDAKQRVLSGSFLNVAVDPSFGVLYYKLGNEEADTHHVTMMDIACPLIIGYQFGRHGPEMTVAPKIIARRVVGRLYAGDVGGAVVLAGEGKFWTLIGGISAGIRLPMPGGFALFPEITVAYPMASTGNDDAITPKGLGGTDLLFTGGIGIGFGQEPGRYYNYGDSLPF